MQISLFLWQCAGHRILQLTLQRIEQVCNKELDKIGMMQQTKYKEVL
jgi:hypothetical protein